MTLWRPAKFGIACKVEVRNEANAPRLLRASGETRWRTFIVYGLRSGRRELALRQRLNPGCTVVLTKVVTP